MEAVDPRERWQRLKARGNYTVEEIEAIDKDTPWSDLGEPAWWLEMMEAQRACRAIAECRSASSQAGPDRVAKDLV